jgi:hypothetical protein
MVDFFDCKREFTAEKSEASSHSKHRSQLVKVVFLGYHLTNESNIASSCVVALKSHFKYSILDVLSLKPFDSKVLLHNSNF